MRFSVVIPAFNEEDYIGHCLDSLLSQDLDSDQFEILVVDNNSTDNTREIVESKGVKLIRSYASRVGKVRNEGAKKAVGDILAFIDSDCVAPKDWLSSAQVLFKDNPQTAALGGECLTRNDASWVEKCWVLKKSPRIRVNRALPGGSFIIKKSIFNEFCGFNERINAGEDTDLSIRICESGWETLLHPQLRVVHLGYPRTALGFLKRQFWQASSYIKSNYGIKDRVFVLTIIFTLGVLGVAASLFLNSFYWLSAVLVLFPPLALTFKRYKESVESVFNRKFFGVLGVSFLYFIGRSAGLVYSFGGQTLKNWS